MAGNVGTTCRKPAGGDILSGAATGLPAFWSEPMPPIVWLLASSLIIFCVMAFFLGRATNWGRRSGWKAPHRRYVQDYQKGDENLSLAERKSLAELEALNLHRRHPYC